MATELAHIVLTYITINCSGVETSRLLYRPRGETRDTYLTTLTTWRFTGQREDCRRRTIRLYFYNARYYDPYLNRFTQPDTIVPNPGDPQAPSTHATRIRELH